MGFLSPFNCIELRSHPLGMHRRKVGFVPGKSGTPEKIAQQEQFREEELEPLLELAKSGKQAVFLWMLLILFTPLF